jgi:uncharacterized RDD family membrane protein YckC
MRDVYADTPDAARFAGFWIRVFANVLDGLVLSAVNVAVLLAVETWETHNFPSGVASVSGRHPGAALFALLSPPIVIIGSWIAFGASPGKMMCRIRIVDEPSGGRLTAWQCIGRYFMALVAIGCAGIGYLWIVIDRRRQGWHDKVVRTLVVRDGRR